MRLPSGNEVERSVRQLSGGEQRRVALALALAFSELASARGCFTCNVLVLDEAGATCEAPCLIMPSSHAQLFRKVEGIDSRRCMVR